MQEGKGPGGAPFLLYRGFPARSVVSDRLIHLPLAASALGPLRSLPDSAIGTPRRRATASRAERTGRPERCRLGQRQLWLPPSSQNNRCEPCRWDRQRAAREAVASFRGAAI